MRSVVACSCFYYPWLYNFKLRESSFQALLSRLAAIRLRDKKVENLWYCPELSRDKRSLAISSSYPEHGGINGCHLWEISRSPLISPCLRAALLRYQTTKEQLHEKLLSAITTFTFLLIFLLSSILAVDWADTGWMGLQHNLQRLTVGRYCAMLCMEEECMDCILCVCVCVWLVSVSDGDCLLSLPRPLWHRGSSRGSGPGLTITQPPLYTVLYCTVLYSAHTLHIIMYHYCYKSMGGTKKIAWDMLKCPPYRGLHCPAGQWAVTVLAAVVILILRVTMYHHFIILRILNFNTQRCRISDVPIKIDRYQLTL